MLLLLYLCAEKWSVPTVPRVLQLPDIPGFPFGIDFEKGQAGASLAAQALLNETAINPVLLQVG